MLTSASEDHIMTTSDAMPSSVVPDTPSAIAFEALKPRRSLWSIVAAGLAFVLVVATAVVEPILTRVNLQDASGYGLGAFVPTGVSANFVLVQLKPQAFGGVTLKSAETDGVQPAGVWVLDAAQEQRLENVTGIWAQSCLDETGALIGTTSVCQLPTGAGQGAALAAALAALGAPLDDSTALPRFIADRAEVTLVVFWDTACHNSWGVDLRFQTARFGISGASSVNLSCYGR